MVFREWSDGVGEEEVTINSLPLSEAIIARRGWDATPEIGFYWSHWLRLVENDSQSSS